MSLALFNFGWQDFVVAAICLAAGLYVARAAWRSIVGRKASGCGASCGKCEPLQAKPVVQIGPPRSGSN